MIAIEKERSEFEAAYKAEWPKSTGLLAGKFDRDAENDEYSYYTVQIAFQMWLAAKRASVDTIDLYEKALLASSPEGAKGDAFDYWNKARIASRQQIGAPLLS